MDEKKLIEMLNKRTEEEILREVPDDLSEEVVEDIEDKAVERQEAEGQTTDKRTEEFRAEAYEAAYDAGYAACDNDHHKIVAKAYEAGQLSVKAEFLTKILEHDNTGKIKQWLKSRKLI
jgi:hypothetical protein